MPFIGPLKNRELWCLQPFIIKVKCSVSGEFCWKLWFYYSQCVLLDLRPETRVCIFKSWLYKTVERHPFHFLRKIHQDDKEIRVTSPCVWEPTSLCSTPLNFTVQTDLLAHEEEQLENGWKTQTPFDDMGSKPV